ncbi:hypothetical protein [Peredibacter starrii]|uniref:Cytochrome c domain-containing protein n=1 Tax=Peredibacter starrii TaxID=28202 RepID=A0AAX4HJH8_9BACT|nr:hypothetical protein [Peredibacter starrii]WPU63378.1 hypothetical protein SOO65_11840 [Peredibacter starrii]
MKKRLLFLAILMVSHTWAGPKEQAWKLHNRLTGVPPKKDVLEVMTNHIRGGRAEDAAKVAMNNPNFYNIVLKNWIKPWSNREQTSRADLNDYVATIIGVVRDEVPFAQVLHSDILYTVSGATPAYSFTNNDHYKNAESRNLNLKDNLVRQTQSAMTGLPATAVAGVTTTRAAGEAFFSAGTNRRVNRFIFMNYLCKDYEELHDVTIPDFRVRGDVERKPGGDARTYKNKCVGCHAGQDALGGAYAYYDFVSGRLNYTQGTVVTKMNHNVYHSDAYVTTDDSWLNLWAQGQNAKLGWRGNTTGSGAKAIGQMFSQSKAFSACIASKVFQLVCMKDAVNTDDKATVDSLANEFEQDNYNLKNLIVNTSVGCITDEDE